MNKAELFKQLDEMDTKLDDTVTGLDRGPVKDAARVLVPAMKDQLKVMRQIVDMFSS
jgi:hypothetical protein